MNKNFRSQKGLTTISLLLILGLVGFFVLILLKLAPIYLENFGIRSALKSLRDESRNDSQVTVLDLQERISKQFQINNINELSPDRVKISRQGDYYDVEAKYEVRRPLVANIDLVVSFDNTVRVRTR